MPQAARGSPDTSDPWAASQHGTHRPCLQSPQSPHPLALAPPYLPAFLSYPSGHLPHPPLQAEILLESCVPPRCPTMTVLSTFTGRPCVVEMKQARSPQLRSSSISGKIELFSCRNSCELQPPINILHRTENVWWRHLREMIYVILDTLAGRLPGWGLYSQAGQPVLRSVVQRERLFALVS